MDELTKALADTFITANSNSGDGMNVPHEYFVVIAVSSLEHLARVHHALLAVKGDRIGVLVTGAGQTEGNAT